MESLQEAAMGHLEVVKKLGWSDELLNRYAPEEYWKKYFEAIDSTSKLILSPYSFFSLPYPNLTNSIHA